MNVQNFLWSTFWVGILSFGGGKAFIPVYQNLYVSSYHLVSSATLQEYIGYALAFPGPISPMITGLVGFFGWGLSGFILGILILTLPSLFLVYGAYRLLNRYQNTKIFQFLNFYIQAGILALLFFVVLEFLWSPFHSLWISSWRTLVFSTILLVFPTGCWIFSLTILKSHKFLALVLKRISPILILSILLGMGFYFPAYRNIFVFFFLLLFALWVILCYRWHPLYLIVLGGILGILCIQI